MKATDNNAGTGFTDHELLDVSQCLSFPHHFKNLIIGRTLWVNILVNWLEKKLQAFKVTNSFQKT